MLGCIPTKGHICRPCTAYIWTGGLPINLQQHTSSTPAQYLHELVHLIQTFSLSLLHHQGITAGLCHIYHFNYL